MNKLKFCFNTHKLIFALCILMFVIEIQITFGKIHYNTFWQQSKGHNLGLLYWKYRTLTNRLRTKLVYCKLLPEMSAKCKNPGRWGRGFDNWCCGWAWTSWSGWTSWGRPSSPRERSDSRTQSDPRMPKLYLEPSNSLITIKGWKTD